MEFDPFKTGNPSDPSGDDYKRQMARGQLKKRTQALEEATLRYILKAFDMSGAVPILRDHQKANFNTEDLTLMALAAVHRDFPVLLKARRILNLANATIGDFIDEKKFARSVWGMELGRVEEEYGGQGKPVGLVFGPAPQIRPGVLVLTKGYYEPLDLFPDAAFRLIREADKKLTVLEPLSSFVSSLKTRWHPG